MTTSTPLPADTAPFEPAPFFSLANHFLIAMPAVQDPFFGGSVVYLCEHSPEGAMGVVINKPSPIRMDQIFDSIKQPTPLKFHSEAVLMGGPVQIDRGFLVHTPVGSWQSSLLVSDDIAVTTSRDILQGLADETQVAKSIATIGYASWGKGQLEEEIANNDWLTVSADNSVLFDLPLEERYQAALNLLGLRAPQLLVMGGAGHA